MLLFLLTEHSKRPKCFQRHAAHLKKCVQLLELCAAKILCPLKRSIHLQFYGNFQRYHSRAVLRRKRVQLLESFAESTKRTSYRYFKVASWQSEEHWRPILIQEKLFKYVYKYIHIRIFFTYWLPDLSEKIKDRFLHLNDLKNVNVLIQTV